jgi:hypothetical protein
MVEAANYRPEHLLSQQKERWLDHTCPPILEIIVEASSKPCLDPREFSQSNPEGTTTSTGFYRAFVLTSGRSCSSAQRKEPLSKAVKGGSSPCLLGAITASDNRQNSLRGRDDGRLPSKAFLHTVSDACHSMSLWGLPKYNAPIPGIDFGAAKVRGCHHFEK